MRDLQAKMLAAVLDGAGLEGRCRARGSARPARPVAILLPARGLAAAAPDEEAPAEVVEYVASALRGNGVAPPDAIEAELEVIAGDERIGSVIALPANGSGPPAALKLDREEVLRAAAFAALAEVAATDARDRLADEVCAAGSSRTCGPARSRRTRRSAAPPGSAATSSAGAVVLAAEIRSGQAALRRRDDHERLGRGAGRAARRRPAVRPATRARGRGRGREGARARRGRSPAGCAATVPPRSPHSAPTRPSSTAPSARPSSRST